MSKNRYRFVERLLTETYSYDDDYRFDYKRIHTNRTNLDFHTLFSTETEPKGIQLGSTIMYQGKPYQIKEIIEDIYMEEVIYVTNKDDVVDIDYKSKAEAYEEYTKDLKDKINNLIDERRDLSRKLTRIEDSKGYRFFKKIGFFKGV